VVFGWEAGAKRLAKKFMSGEEGSLRRGQKIQTTKKKSSTILRKRGQPFKKVKKLKKNACNSGGNLGWGVKMQPKRWFKKKKEEKKKKKKQKTANVSRPAGETGTKHQEGRPRKVGNMPRYKKRTLIRPERCGVHFKGHGKINGEKTEKRDYGKNNYPTTPKKKKSPGNTNSRQNECRQAVEKREPRKQEKGIPEKGAEGEKKGAQQEGGAQGVEKKQRGGSNKSVREGDKIPKPKKN